ncbi:helix-turn-helix transcriptional regulator [Rhizorhabdus wittichii DC-6]|jgi:DNA-binding CsgD family transcriptional regulator|nr:helix-turn-helix transcriptional regulator [Rhizorhabdus wittichii DC-6]
MTIAAAIDAIARPGFASTVVEGISRPVGVAHLSVFLFQQALSPVVALAFSRDGSDIARRAGEAYLRLGLYLGDPLRSALRARLDDGDATVRLFSDDPGAANAARRAFFARFDLGQRLTIFGHTRLGWMSVNLYRDRDAATLPRKDVRALEQVAPLIHAAVARHLELVDPSIGGIDLDGVLGERLKRLDRGLTPRETDVCLAALGGRANAEIAAALGIGLSTVGTLRRRAYERLGVSNIAELFLVCLNATR